MARAPQPLFLARQSYRRRRLGDAARLVPLLGVVLLMMPVFWSSDNSTASGVIYIFAVWGGLIAIIGFLARPLDSLADEHDRSDSSGDTDS